MIVFLMYLIVVLFCSYIVVFPNHLVDMCGKAYEFCKKHMERRYKKAILSGLSRHSRTERQRRFFMGDTHRSQLVSICRRRMCVVRRVRASSSQDLK